MDVRKFPAALTLGFTVIAGAGASFVAAVHVATYGPASWGPVLFKIALAAFPAMFPVFGFAVIATAFGRLPLDRLAGDLPRPVIVAGVVVFIYVAVDFALMIRLLPRTSDQQATPLGSLYGARLFTGHEIVFFGVSALIGYELDRIRRGKLNLNAGPRDDALEQHPLPPPLSRQVTLQSMLTAEECAQRLLQPIPQGFFAFFGRYGVRGEATSAGFRLELAGAQSSMVYAVGRFEGSGRPVFMRILLTFKRWPLVLLGLTAAVIPVVWLFFVVAGFPFPWPGFLFVFVFGIGGNFLFGLGQMQSLLNQIKRATSAEPFSAG